MIKNLLISLGLVASMMGGAQAGETLRCNTIAVVELFTSQGCSSCPPADEVLAQIGAREDVIALAYHVDYWDYIGWPDTFGSAANSDYQRAYAAAQGKNRIYTPQLMINGRTDVVGSRRGDVDGALSAAKLEVPIMLTTEDGMLHVDIGGQDGLDLGSSGEAAVWVVTYKTAADVDIGRGENRGRKISYSHIVTSRQVLGMWSADEGARIRLPLKDVLGPNSDGAAILLQADDKGLPGAILGAASISL